MDNKILEDICLEFTISNRMRESAILYELGEISKDTYIEMMRRINDLLEEHIIHMGDIITKRGEK